MNKETEEELPKNVRLVIVIAKRLDELNLKLPRELVFEAAVKALLNEPA